MGFTAALLKHSYQNPLWVGKIEVKRGSDFDTNNLDIILLSGSKLWCRVASKVSDN